MKHGALIHKAEDDVVVVVMDVASGTEIKAVTLEGEEIANVTAVEDIPLGHKMAMRDIAKGKEVFEYGRAIGKASLDIARGAHVHTHNLKSIRWGQQ